MSYEPKMLFLSTDGEGGGGTGEGSGEGTGEGTQTKPKLADLVREYSLQDDLNAMMAENRRKLTQQNTELVKQLEDLKRNTALTQDERDALQTRITQLEEQYMSKEELAKREATKQQREFETKLQKATEQGERWQSLYADSTIQRAWQDAALEGKVLQPAIPGVVDMFRHQTQLTEVMENGQPTGRYTPVVKFNDVNEDGQNVVLDLSPTEAIKRMKELPDRYGYLFEGTATSGIGSARRADGSAPAPKLDELLKDPAKYAEWRKKNPDLDLSKLR